MPRCICCVEDRGKRYFLLWSTVVDAPVSDGMELDQFKNYMKALYGTEGWPDLDKSIERAIENGNSFHTPYDKTFEDFIKGNRAGQDEEELTLKQLIKFYIRDPIRNKTA